MKKICIFFFVFVSLSANCKEKNHHSFEYQYDVPSEVTFDFTKSYSVPAGSVALINRENKTKKFRYINNSPLGYFFNRRTNKTYRMSIVSHNADSEKLDSLFWAFLGSATYHTPVKPYNATTLTLYLNINANPKPAEITEYVVQNYKDLEYHIFNPAHFPPITGKHRPPDAIIHSIKVILK